MNFLFSLSIPPLVDSSGPFHSLCLLRVNEIERWAVEPVVVHASPSGDGRRWFLSIPVSSALTNDYMKDEVVTMSIFPTNKSPRFVPLHSFPRGPIRQPYEPQSFVLLSLVWILPKERLYQGHALPV